MASCSLGASTNSILPNLLSSFKKIKCSGSDAPFKVKCAGQQTSFGLRRFQLRPDQVHAKGFCWESLRSTKPLNVSSGVSSGKNDIEVGALEEKQSNGNELIPSSPEVESLLNVICDTTSIAECELNISGFRLYVKRNINGKLSSPPTPSPPIQVNFSNEVLDQNGSASTTSLALSKPKPFSGSIQRILDASSDEGLMILQSPKVGFFRRSRTIKGKRAPPSCKEKQEVKEGQVLCYIEQLGGEIPIESDVSGEVIKILRKDGEPVGYGDDLIAILPSFPGIKKLQ
ncbi:hypothetical protein J5N97_004022 [Dioscorea zingiberensis]|uniref:Lipoyl-binding domain-containing protein n=1 Tax=Dioscorea zingiberensis TaxID=325984 RepID=A0A9D5HR80_9LILI|nr:hypothetical protein J5N97_004022 [Dioscorea zingiberensis]